jgi:DnaK suppressor protein
VYSTAKPLAGFEALTYFGRVVHFIKGGLMAKASAKKSAKPSAKSAPAAKSKPAPKAMESKLAAKPEANTSKQTAKASPVVIAPSKPKKAYKPAKLPSGYKPTQNEDYMSPLQLEYFRQKLLAWRKELMDESRETLDHLHDEDWHQADIADRASLETEAGVELRTRNRYLKLISKIDAAIRRIEDGDYGYCEETGEPIGLKRLEARPVATLSIEAQERHEKAEKQYTDED